MVASLKPYTVTVLMYQVIHPEHTTIRWATARCHCWACMQGGTLLSLQWLLMVLSVEMLTVIGRDLLAAVPQIWNRLLTILSRYRHCHPYTSCSKRFLYVGHSLALLWPISFSLRCVIVTTTFGPSTVSLIYRKIIE